MRILIAEDEIATAKSEIEDRIAGLEAGADDYLPKPFSTGELIARVKALGRRSENYSDSEKTAGNLVLDGNRYEMRVADTSVSLTNKEFQLMELFVQHPGYVFSADHLMEKIWGPDTDSNIDVVWTHIGYVRKKLRSIGADVEIKTIRGAGYSLSSAREEQHMKYDFDDCHMSVDVMNITAEGSSIGSETVLLREHELNIIINGLHIMKLVCTKNDLYELVLGRLLTGGFIDKAEDVSDIYFCKYKTEANVVLSKEIDFEEAYFTERSCCTGNRIWYTNQDSKEIKRLPKPEYKPEWIFHLAERFKQGYVLHDMTSGTHSCMLARGDEVLFICEDIGRHNALDKAVGYGLSTGIPLSQCILYTSGRVPVDMAEKSIAAGVPVLASKSCPTAEAVELARRAGLVIIGNAHPDSMKVFDPYI